MWRGLNEEIGQNDKSQVGGGGAPWGEATLVNCHWCNPCWPSGGSEKDDIVRLGLKITFSGHRIRATDGLQIWSSWWNWIKTGQKTDNQGWLWDEIPQSYFSKCERQQKYIAGSNKRNLISEHKNMIFFFQRGGKCLENVPQISKFL